MSSSAALEPSPASSAVPHESTRRRLSAKQARTVQLLVEATVDELRGTGFDGLTVRRVAARAGVAPATAYNYFGGIL